MPKRDVNLLYEDSNGTVTRVGDSNKVRVEYDNLVWEDSVSDFKSLTKSVSGLYGHVKEIRQVYYKKFLISLNKYKTSFVLNASELERMSSFLNGADIMLELQDMIEEVVTGKKSNEE